MHGGVEGSWVSFDGFALSGESLQVLERVVIELSALLLILVDELSVALEVSWVWCSSHPHGLEVMSEELLHLGVDLHSVGEFVLESLVVLWSCLLHDFVVEVVHLDVSGVDGEGGLSFVEFLSEGFPMHLTFVLENFPPVLLRNGISSGLEVSEWLGVEGE